MSLQLQDGGVLAREEIPSSDVVRERFGYLDGLRTLAILAVVVAEVAKNADLLVHVKPELAALFRACSHGLDLFFIISGFALAYPILTLVHQEGQTYLDVSRYALKRLLRVVPTYYAVIGLTVLIPLLAGRLQLGALEGPLPSQAEIVRQALFVGNALPNDGFWSLALTMRWYVLFPFLVLLWVRLPIGFLAATAGLWVLNFLTPAHLYGAGVLPAFMLGILAADIRAQRHRIERYALPLALVAGAAAVYFEPFFAGLPGTIGQPPIFAINPVWQIALFLLLVGVGFFGVIERLFGLRIFGWAAAFSYAVSLVADPVTGFMSRRLTHLGSGGAAVNAGAVAIIMGVILWQLIDRWFSDGSLRPRLVDALAPILRAVLNLVRAANVHYAGRGRLRPVTVAQNTSTESDDLESAGFYAPPPRGSGDLAVVMQRTGSPEQLAAEILETKKRLAEQSAALFADPEPEPVIPVREPERTPGFYEHGQRAAPAPLDVPVSIDADPFVAAQPVERTPALAPPPAPQPSLAVQLPAYSPPPAAASPAPPAAPPPAAAQPAYAPAAYAPIEPPPPPAPELEGWLIPKSFEEDFSRAAAAPEPAPAPELPGWIHAVEPRPEPGPYPMPPPVAAQPPPAFAAQPSPPAAPIQPPAYAAQPPPAYAPQPPPAYAPQPPAYEAPPSSYAPVPAAQPPQPPPAYAPEPPSHVPPPAAAHVPQAPPAYASQPAPPPYQPPVQTPIAMPPLAQPVASPPPPAPQPQPAIAMPTAAQAQPAAPPSAGPPGAQPIAMPPAASPSGQPIAMPPAASPRPLPPAPPPQPAVQSAPIAMPPRREEPVPPAQEAIPVYARADQSGSAPFRYTTSSPAEPSNAARAAQAYVEPAYVPPSYNPPAYTAPVAAYAQPPAETAPAAAADPATPATRPAPPAAEPVIQSAPARAALGPAPQPAPPQPPPPTAPLPLQAAPLPAPPPSFRESQEAAAGQAVRNSGGVEQSESSSAAPPLVPSTPGQRVTISLRPARPPIRVRIGPSPLASTSQASPSSNGKHALDDVIDG